MSYGGFIIIFDEKKRSSEIEEIIKGGGKFSDALSLSDWKIHEKELCFLSFDYKYISYAALVKKSRFVATKKVRVDFNDFVQITPISFDEIENSLRSLIRPYFINVISNNNGGRLPPVTWKEVFNLVIKLRPESEEQLIELERLRTTFNERLGGHGYDILSQEKDAVSLAFKLFSPHKDIPSLRWTNSASNDNSIAPFLQGVTHPNITEDIFINHDSNVFADWRIVNRHNVGSIEYFKDNQKLTIVNCNRTRIEKNLVVDLVYYHHRYDSYVLVHYKKMIKEERGEEILPNELNINYPRFEKKLSYRPIEKSYKKEVDTIKNFLKLHPCCETNKDLTSFRLLSNGFYFKLCEVEEFRPQNIELIKGMYIPFNYWETLLKSEEAKGPRGGLAIGYHNVGRYINNTLFIQLVENGWIGTTGLTSKDITTIIKQSLENDRSLVLAISELIE